MKYQIGPRNIDMHLPINQKLTRRPALLTFLLPIFLSVVFLGLAERGYAQAFPGGVNNGLVGWFRSDAGNSCVIPSPVNCTPTNTWTNVTGGTNATLNQGGGNTNYVIPSMNFNEAFTTSGSHIVIPELGDTEDDRTVFVVFKTASTASNGSTQNEPVIFGGRPGNNHDSYYITMNNGTINYHQTDNTPTTESLSTTGKYNDNTAHIVTHTRDNVGSGADPFELWVDARDYQMNPDGHGGDQDNYNNLGLGRHADLAQGQLNADYAELILFEEVLTANQIQRVETYLAVKYGITLPKDYMNGNNATIYALDGTYDYNIIGVCFEDNTNRSSFVQNMSTSSTDQGGLILMYGHGFGGVVPPNLYQNSFTPGAQDYFLMGHNGGGTDFTCASGITPNARMARIYKSQNTGMGAVSDSITLVLNNSEFVGLEIGQPVGTYRLVVDNNPSFPAPTNFVITDHGGGKFSVEFPATAASGTSYFTIETSTPVGIPAPLPGGISDCQSLDANFIWLRADTGFACATTSATCNFAAFDTIIEQSQPQDTFRIRSTGATLPIWEPAEMNFNGVIRFPNPASGNPYLQFLRLPRPQAFEHDVTVVAVLKTGNTLTNTATVVDQPTIIGMDDLGNQGDMYLTMNADTVKWTVHPIGSDSITLSSTTLHGDNVPFIIVGDRSDSGPDPMNLYINGTNEANTNGVDGALGNIRNVTLPTIGNSNDTQSPLESDISEILIFNNTLTQNERERLETYLAIKYGITLGHDYLAYDGSNIYTVAGYGDNIIGIGREDATGSLYHQKQSKSATEPNGITLFSGNRGGNFPALNKANNDDLNVGEYFVMGHDGADSSFIAIYNLIPGARMNRVYRMQETGIVGDDITILIETAAGTTFDTLATVGGNFAMVISNDLTFDINDAIYPLTQGGTDSLYVELTIPGGVNFMSFIDLDAPTPAGDPGGTNGQDLTLWLKADTGHANVNSNNVNAGGQWFDNSYSGNNGFFSNPNVFTRTETNLADLNFNESISTPNSSYVNFKRNAQDALSIAVVVATNYNVAGQPIRQQGAILGGSNNGPDEYFLTMDNGDFNWGISNGGTVEFIGSTSSSYNRGDAHIIFVDRDTTNAGGSISMRIDGQSIGSNSLINLNSLSTNDSLRLGIHPSGFGALNGRYGEVLIYDTVMVQTDKEKLETYLALKYGITLDHDYLDTAGTIVYDQNTYSNRIFGMASEDFGGTLFKQTVSQSQTSAALTVMAGTGHAGVIPASNFANINDTLPIGSYIVFGDDDGGGGNGAFSRPLAGNPNQLLDLTWKVTTTGVVDAVGLLFDGSVLTDLTGADQYSIVISDDPTFDDQDFTRLLEPFAGNVYYVENDFPDNTTQYFSIIKNPVPGGVAGIEIIKWLDANYRADTVGFTPGVQWAPRSGLHFGFSNDITHHVGGANFNNYLELTNDHIATIQNQSADFGMFVVFRSDSAVNSGTWTGEPAVLSGVLDESSGNRFALTSLSQGQFRYRLRDTLANDFFATNPPAITSPHQDYLHIAYIDFDQALNPEFGFDGSYQTASGSFNVNMSEGDSLRMGRFNPGVFPSAPLLSGDIAEFIEFNVPVTGNDRDMVSTYLAIKYGITLPHNYLQSGNSNVIYYPFNFPNEIVGVGQDSTTFLDQQASQPASNPQGMGIIAGSGHSAFPNVNSDVSPGIPQDHFLLIGHDGAPTTQTASFNGTSGTRMQRIYKAYLTGSSPQTATLVFNGGFGQMLDSVGTDSSLALVVSADTIFSFTGGDAVIAMNEWSTGVHAGVYNFPNNDSVYISIAKVPEPLAPGGLADNVSMWLQAGVGYTDGAGNDTWNNLMDPLNNMVESPSASSLGISAGLLNYNPYVSSGPLTRNFRSQSGINGGTYIAVMNAITSDSLAGLIGQTSGALETGIRSPGGVGSQIQNGNAANDFTRSGGELWVDGSLPGTLFDIDKWSIVGANTISAGTGAASGFFYIGGFESVSSQTYQSYNIAEVIVFEDSIQYQSRIRQVETYLAIKYGFTLQRSYVSSYGVTLFDTLADAIYFNDVAGIARDDTTGLDQRQSKSINGGSVIAMGLDSINISNATNTGAFLQDSTWLLWGNDGESLCWSNSNFAVSTAATDRNHYIRVARQWKVNKIGSVDSMHIKVDTMFFTQRPGMGGFYFALDDDGIFDSNSLLIPMSGNGAGDIEAFFAGNDFDTRPFFTIGARLDSVDFLVQDYCGNDVIELYGSNIGNDSVCGFIQLFDGTNTRQIYRNGAVAPSITSYRVIFDAPGDCLDRIRFLANPGWASNDTFEVSVFLNPTLQPVTNPTCLAGGGYSDNTKYTLLDSITLGVGGSTNFEFTDSVFCLGGGNILPDVSPTGAPGVFYTVDTAGFVSNTPGLIGDSTFGFLLVHSGVIDTHIVCYDLLGYCPSDVPTCDTIEIRDVTPTLFVYDTARVCDNSTQADTLTVSPGTPGLFSSYPTMVFLDPSDGSFTPDFENPGFYTVTFTPNDSTCFSSYSDTITIDPVQQADFLYPQGAYCPFNGDAIPTINYIPTSPAGWVFESPDPAVSVDPNTGRVDLALTPDSSTHIIRYSPPGGLACADTFTTTINIAGLPNVSFAPQVGYCFADLPQPLNPLIPSGGGFTSPTGHLFFSGFTLDSAAIGGPFPVTYSRDSVVAFSPTVVTCTDSLTQLITITGLPPAVISYPNLTLVDSTYAFCVGEPNPFPIFAGGPAGGTFVSLDSANLVIDPNTGEILLGSSNPGTGTHQINYAVASPGCNDTIIVGYIRYEAVPDPSFTLDTTFVCEDLASIGVATLATANPTPSFFFNGPNGFGPLPFFGNSLPVQNTMLPGNTYTIINVQEQNFNNSGYTCHDTAFQYLFVEERDVANVSYPTQICNNQGAPNPVNLGTGGGIFTDTSTVITVDSFSGQITDLPDAGITGTFTINYVTQGSCPDSLSSTIQILPGQVSRLSYPQSEVCNTVGTLSIDTTGISSTLLNDFFFIDTIIPSISLPGLIDPNTGDLDLSIVTSNISVTVGRIVLSAGSCSDTSFFQIQINDFLNNLDLDYGADTFCATGTIVPTLTGVSNITEGEFRPRAGLAYANDTIGEVDLSSTSPDRLYVIEYRRSVGCLERVSDTIYVKSFDDGDFSYEFSSYCSRADSVIEIQDPLNAVGSFSGIGGNVNSVLVWSDITVGSIDLLLTTPDQYDITFTTVGFCPVTVTQTVNIARQPEILPQNFIVTPPDAAVCGTEIPTFEIDTSGFVTWLVDSIPQNVLGNLFIYNNPVDGALVTGVLENSDGCSDSVSVRVQLKDLPDGEPTTWPSVLTGDLPLEINMASFTDTTSFRWIAVPSSNLTLDSLSGESETINTGFQTTLINGVTLASDFNPASVTYFITPWSQGCVGEEDTLVININPNENPIFIPGVMTPNGDLFNDTWLVQWSSDLDPNDYTIILFNRAGGEVFRMNPINPNFDGGSLPDGVYWWVLYGPDGPTGESVNAGGLTIRRR